MSTAAITTERRAEPRRPMSEVASVSAVRVGPETVSVVDISCGGLLMDCSKWVRRNSEIRLKVVDDAGQSKLVPALVIESQVAGFDSAAVKYRTRVTFKTPLELVVNEAPAPMPVEEPPADEAPVIVPTSQVEPLAAEAEEVADAMPDDTTLEQMMPIVADATLADGEFDALNEW